MKKTSSILAVSTLGLAAVAFSQQTKGPVPGRIDFDEQQRTSATAFWTGSQLESAKPMPLPMIDPQSVSKKSNAAAAIGGAVVRIGGQAPTLFLNKEDLAPAQELKLNNEAASDQTPTPEPQGFGYTMPFTNHRATVSYGYPWSAVGKLFFEIPGQGTYVCSASVAMNTHTLVTARHCVYDYASGTWYRNFVFYPGYSGGSNPLYHNGWTIRRTATWTSNAAGFDYDIAFAQVNDDKGYGCNGSSGGSPIGAYTGYLGATWNGDYSQRQWSILGYPQASPFTGAYQFEDEGATGVLNPFGYTNTIEVGNPQTGGTSGGPWVIGLDPKSLPLAGAGNNILSASANMVNSVNSFKWTNPDHSLSINGPAFLTYNFANLYSFYAGLSCP